MVVVFSQEVLSARFFEVISRCDDDDDDDDDDRDDENEIRDNLRSSENPMPASRLLHRRMLL